MSEDRIAGEKTSIEQLDRARMELEQAERNGDYARAGELQHGVIPDLERKLAAASSSDGESDTLLREEVTDQDIAAVVSRWTGVPVDRMLEGERDKLLRMESELAKRVIGQQEALEAVSKSVRRARAGLQDPNRPLGSFLFWGRLALAKQSSPKRWRLFCLTMTLPWCGSTCLNLWKSMPWHD